MTELSKVYSPGGRYFSEAKAHAPRFEGFLKALEGKGYPIHQDQSGGYNYRNIAGTNRLSNHARGAAIDINWSLNPRDNTHGHIGKQLGPDVVRSLAKEYGLRWGGDYSHKDAMHFEVDGDWNGPPATATPVRYDNRGMGAPVPLQTGRPPSIIDAVGKGSLVPEPTLPTAAPYIPGADQQQNPGSMASGRAAERTLHHQSPGGGTAVAAPDRRFMAQALREPTGAPQWQDGGQTLRWGDGTATAMGADSGGRSWLDPLGGKKPPVTAAPETQQWNPIKSFRGLFGG